MKLEKRGIDNGVLKMEVMVLRETEKRNCTHFCRCIDAGQFRDVVYMVMTLIGRSLADLRKDLPEQKFSMGCALSVGIRCVEAIEELHGAGFLHRDLKPSNYAVGEKDVRRVYLFDFGMCRRFREPDGRIRQPRISPGFRGTVRYAPLSGHIRREQSPKCDLESWLYQQVELTRGALPWRAFDNRDFVAMYKERSRFDAGLREFLGGCPREYIEILRYVDHLRYYDTPDYNRITKCLRHSMASLGVEEFPYDWEDGSPYFKQYEELRKQNDQAIKAIN